MSIADKLIKLPEEDRSLFFYKLKEVMKNTVTEDTSSKKLVAYIKAGDSLVKDDLKGYLKSSLPSYMIPSSIIEIDEFPLLPNGKIDKNSLPSYQKSSSQTSNEKAKVQPVNHIQQKLIDIWEEVLQIDGIAIEDNFFEIGGDSISSIQIIAKARTFGFKLEPKQLFSYQTIAELSLFVEIDDDKDKRLNEKLIGETSLLPIQHWFFETHKNGPHYWNHIIEVSNFENFKANTWQKALEHLISFHDALRLRFYQNEQRWMAEILAEDDIKSFIPIDLTECLSIDEQEDKIRFLLNQNQEEKRLEEGSLFRGLYFECGKLQKNKFFLIAHHLVIDIVSWNIIFNDLMQSVTNSENGLDGNKKTASVKVWSEHLMDYAKSEALKKEIPYWKSQQLNSYNLPTDFTLEKNVFEESSLISKQINIQKNDLQNILDSANNSYNTRTEDLLITALAMTITKWSQNQFMYLNLERHGRALEDEALDISNTVGWFTSFFPFKVPYNNTEELGKNIKLIKESLRAIPKNGIGFGVLSYLNEKSEINEEYLEPPIVFNYLGKQKSEFSDDEVGFKFASEPSYHPRSERSYLIEINSYISEDSIVLDIRYTNEAFKEETISALVDKMKLSIDEVINHCSNQETKVFTPSDFPEAEISQDDLDQLFQDL